ncbi:hypothetical protein EVAR_52575_1 [Eumeta japonica]|uniref:Uncharacterized protein n=1 Tax=Eumeta variegata TaxID=151549 RepID=A0A4C1YAZ5_EUMVA|nr:hypothetical protein EVAR_52575_1 [Eumeta japonica]
MAVVFQGSSNEDLEDSYNNYNTLAALRSKKKSELSLYTVRSDNFFFKILDNAEVTYEDIIKEFIKEYGCDTSPDLLSSQSRSSATERGSTEPRLAPMRGEGTHRNFRRVTKEMREGSDSKPRGEEPLFVEPVRQSNRDSIRKGYAE